MAQKEDNIPKIIHYCWFGGGKLPNLAKKCMKSWKKFCPDFKIILWDENNCDLENAPIYVKEAYENKKWAFVSDYFRLQIVYTFGGIYLDTDVELIKSLDDFLIYDAFFGFEDSIIDNRHFINTGLGFGAKANSSIVEDLLNDYNNIHYIQKSGVVDQTPCPIRNAHVFEEYGFCLNGKTQQVNNIIVLSSDFFCPLTYESNRKKAIVTINTRSIHHFAYSWREKRKPIFIRVMNRIKRLILEIKHKK